MVEKTEYTKPLVTLELAEYNSILKYIQTLEEILANKDEPYKKALEEICTKFYGGSMNQSNTIINVLIKHKLFIERPSLLIEQSGISIKRSQE